MNYIALIIFFILPCIVMNDYANVFSNKEIKIVSASTPPYYYSEDHESKIKGIEVEIVTHVLNQMHLNFKFYKMSWNKALKNTENGTYDLLVHALYTSIKNEKLYVSDPLFNREFTFYKRKDSNLDLKNIKKIINYRVGIASGYGLEDLLPFKLKNIYNIYGENNALTGLLKVYLKDIDFFLCDINICKTVIEKRKLNFPELENIDDIGKIKLKDSSVRVAFSKENNISRDLIKDFNEQLEKFKKSMEYKVIFNKYNAQVENDK